MKTHIVFATAVSALVLSAALAFAQGTPTTGMSHGIAQPATSLAPVTSEMNLVPPGTVLPPIPIGSHYVCYPVKSPVQYRPRVATFRDQFGVWTVTVTGITHLCLPAEKRVPTKVYPMVNPKVHLTCYAIRYVGKVPPLVVTNDQFGAQKLTLAPATTVCLPAGKLIIHNPPPPPPPPPLHPIPTPNPIPTPDKITN